MQGGKIISLGFDLTLAHNTSCKHRFERPTMPCSNYQVAEVSSVEYAASTACWFLLYAQVLIESAAELTAFTIKELSGPVYMIRVSRCLSTCFLEHLASCMRSASMAVSQHDVRHD
jgi:hypothetical protein